MHRNKLIYLKKIHIKVYLLLVHAAYRATYNRREKKQAARFARFLQLLSFCYCATCNCTFIRGTLPIAWSTW